MSEEETPKRRFSPLSIVLFVLVAAALVTAFVIVSRHTVQVEEPEVPLGLGVNTVDTSVVRYPKTLRRKLTRLEDKYREYRDSSVVFTAEQDSMAGVCDSAFRVVWTELGVLDTLTGGENRVEQAKKLKRMYADLKKPVHRFAKSFRVSFDSLDTDSLDAVLEKLLSD